MDFYKTFKLKIPNNKEKKIVIKIHKNKNEYFLTDDKIWVRNFAKSNAKPIDINNFYSESEIKILLENELRNQEIKTFDFSSEVKENKKILIISDGYGFENSFNWIDKVPSDVKIIANYGACRRWNSKRLPNYMVMNNPFEDALIYLPEKVFPILLTSSRTNHNFIKRYINAIIKYYPTPDVNYESPASHDSSVHIDEYRSSLAASIAIAYKMGCEKLCIAYPINAYDKERPGTEKIEDTELFFYPQQRIARNIIDANIFWYKLAKNKINICYTGIKNSLQFANYIEPDIIKNIYEH